MSSKPSTLRAAEARADQAQRQLNETVAELKRRLQPSTLAGDAWGGVKDRGSNIADKGVQVVKDRPAAVGGVLAALTLFVFRAPIAKLATSLFGADREDDGRITTDLSDTDQDFDLTAPVVDQKEGELA